MPRCRRSAIWALAAAIAMATARKRRTLTPYAARAHSARSASTGSTRVAVQDAVARVAKCKLLSIQRESITAIPLYAVLRPWAGERLRRSRPLRRAGENRSRRNQLLSQRVDPHVHPFEGARAEDDHIRRLGEDDVVGRLRSGGMDDGDADWPLQVAAIGDDKSLCHLRSDPKVFEHVARHPGELAAGVHKCVLDGSHVAPVLGAFNDHRRAEGSHVSHANSLRRMSRIV